MTETIPKPVKTRSQALAYLFYSGRNRNPYTISHMWGWFGWALHNPETLSFTMVNDYPDKTQRYRRLTRRNYMTLRFFDPKFGIANMNIPRFWADLNAIDNYFFRLHPNRDEWKFSYGTFHRGGLYE